MQKINKNFPKNNMSSINKFEINGQEVLFDDSKLTELSSEIGNMIDIDLLKLEQGGIQTSTGLVVDNPNRLRTIDYIKGNMLITVPIGYILYSIIYYDESYKYINGEEIKQQSIKVNSSNFFKLTFACVNTTQAISLESFKKLHIIDNIIDDIKETKDSLSNNLKVVTFTRTIIKDVLESTTYYDCILQSNSSYMIIPSSHVNMSISEEDVISKERIIHNISATTPYIIITPTSDSYLRLGQTKEVIQFDIVKLGKETIVEKLKKGIIKLSAWATANILSNIDIGDFGYNETTNKIIYKTGESSYYAIDIDKNSLYEWKGYYYVFNNNILQRKIQTVDIPSPMVVFNYDYEMGDFSDELKDMPFFSKDELGCLKFMPALYSKFNSLVDSCPEYISKEDAYSMASVSYPEYANLNGETSGDYAATPSYRTYIYKLIDKDNFINTDYNKKKILFIIGGTHGNELAAPFNLYLFAKKLCEASDSNYAKLRASYDIYILPCLNGYGLLHQTRVNANGVNLNRNYPIKNWSLMDVPFGDDYTGVAAASERETKLIMNLTNIIKPDVAIDHHNYGTSNGQFYSEINTLNHLRLSHQSLVDCSIAFIHNLPQYFGNKYKLFDHQTTASAPGFIPPINKGTTNLWWYENKIKFSSTIEISNCINFDRGVNSDIHKSEQMTNDVFKVGEYTLRNQILRYCQCVMNEG